MKNLFSVNFAENTIVASKTTLKKAGIPNSAEYKDLMKLTKQHPTFEVVAKEIKKHEGKKTHKGLTEKFILAYISIQPNANDLTAQYKDADETGNFPLVRRWFLATFKDFDMATAKKELDEAEVKKITAKKEQDNNNEAEQKNDNETERKDEKVSDFPAVVNQ